MRIPKAAPLAVMASICIWGAAAAQETRDYGAATLETINRKLDQIMLESRNRQVGPRKASLQSISQQMNQCIANQRQILDQIRRVRSELKRNISDR